MINVTDGGDGTGTAASEYGFAQSDMSLLHTFAVQPAGSALPPPTLMQARVSGDGSAIFVDFRYRPESSPRRCLEIWETTLL